MPPLTTNFTDLDPQYTDLYGDPLERMTMDYSGQGTAAANYLAPYFAALLTKMGASNVTTAPNGVAGAVPQTSWTIHIRGGCRVGSDSSTSVLNKWQQSWTVANLFAGGEVTDTVGSNDDTSGTHTAGLGRLSQQMASRSTSQAPDLSSKSDRHRWSSSASHGWIRARMLPGGMGSARRLRSLRGPRLALCRSFLLTEFYPAPRLAP